MESRYQESRLRPAISSAAITEVRWCDPNLPFSAPALPFEARYQETAWKLQEPSKAAEGGVTSWHDFDLGPWCGDFLQQREILLCLPGELHFNGHFGTSFSGKAVSCSGSYGFGPAPLQVRSVSVRRSVGACTLGKAGDTLGKWKI